MVAQIIVGALATAASSGPVSDPVRPPSVQSEDGVIIVTGERIRRSLKETPSSVQIFNAREIERSSASRVDELLALVPNVTPGSGSQGPTIRGQDTTGALQALPAFLGGNRPRTTLVIDGRRQTYNEFVFGDAPLWDVERVEVFRSPQTTTQGQNSIAGAIFVHSNDPVFEPEARGRLIAGTIGTRQASAMLSGPVNDDLAVRLSGDLRYSRATSKIADVMAGADPNHHVHGQVRAKLLVRPGAVPDARFEVTFTHVEAQSPQIEGVRPPFERRRDEKPGYGVFRTRVSALTGVAQYSVAPGLSATITATGGDTLSRRYAIPGFGEAINKGRDWGVDALINWSRPGLVEAVAGVSRTQVRLRQAIDLSVFSGLGQFRDVQDGFGMFGQADVTLLPRLTVSAGLRYQQDRQHRIGEFEAPTKVIPLDYDRTFRAWLPKVSLAYDVTPQTRIGAFVQRAYNPGGTTLRFDLGEADNFGAERLWNYEAFVRSSLLDGRLNLTGNLFVSDIRNAQRSRSIQILAPNGIPVGFADLFNLDRARTYGAEGEIHWRVSEALDLRGSGGLLFTKVLKAGPAGAIYQDKQFERSPHFSGAASLDWRPFERFSIHAAVRHNSAYFSDDANDPKRRIRGFTTADVRADWRSGRLSLFGYARNVFNDFYLTYLSAADNGTAGDPREIGIGVECGF